MQYDFTYHNPTRIHFGKTALDQLASEIALFGSRVLLVMGGGSVRRTGLHSRVMDILGAAGKHVWEFAGVPSNPTAAKVYEGIDLARKFAPDLILALGGGSVIDCAKAIACGAMTRQDFWQTFFLDGEEPEDALPLGVVLTMAGTGSEANGEAVITHSGQKIKTGMESAALFPVFSILNPELTFTVPRTQMVSGICDVMSHILETYMSPTDRENISDELAEALMRRLIAAAHQAVQNPHNYAARAAIMWCATLSLGGLLQPCKQGDWMAHQIEHQLGAYTACPHGLGLAAISPAYYRLVAAKAPERFCRFAVNVWGIDPAGHSKEALALAGVAALERFFADIGAPTSLRQLGLPEDTPLTEIADSVTRLKGGYMTLSRAQVRKLLRDSL